MRIELRDGQGKRVAVRAPKASDPTVRAREAMCPGCGAPLEVRGGLPFQRGRDRYTAPAHCAGCGAHVGELAVVVSTIFGLEEDERVLRGRARVY